MQNLIRYSAVLMFGVWASCSLGDEPDFRMAKVLQSAKVRILHTKDAEPDGREMRYWHFRDVVIPGELQFRPDENLQSDKAICGLKIDGDTDPAATLTSETLHELDPLIPQIRYLILENNRRLAEVFLERLSEFRNLRQLWIRFPSIDAKNRLPVSDQCLQAIPSLTQLQNLRLIRLDIRDEFVARFSALTQLRELRIMPTNEYGYSNKRLQVDLTAQTLSSAVKMMPKLETLVVNGCPLEGTFDWDAIARLSHLKSIQLTRANLGDKEASGIGALQQVTELDLQETKISGAAISDIVRMKKLEKLNVKGTNVRSGVTQLSSLPELVVSHSSDVFRDEGMGPPQLKFLLKTSDATSPVESTDEDLLSLANLEKLSGGIREVNETDGHLRISFHDMQNYKQVRLNRRLSDRDLAEINALGQLTSFIVSRDEVVTSELTAAIANHPAIKFVRLGKLNLDSELGGHLSSLPALESIDLRNAEIHAGAFQGLGELQRLKRVTILNSRFVSAEQDRVRGLESVPQLTVLKLQTENGSDDDCRWLAQSQSIGHFSFWGNFTAKSLQYLAKLRSANAISLFGIKDFDPHTEVRQMKNPSLEYLQLNPSSESRLDSSGVYSEAVARELGIKMAGDCSCSCMDAEPPNATVIPNSAFHIDDNDELWLKDEYLDDLKAANKLTGWFRIVGPFNRERLIYHGTQLPFSQGVFFSDCDLKTLDLIDCRQEVGVFGNVDQLTLHEEAPYAEQTTSVNLFLAGVNDVEFTSARRLETISVTGQLNSLSLKGEFPLLGTLHPVSTSGLQYLAAPYSGAAPRLAFPDYLPLTAMKDLRLLKIPYTLATDKLLSSAASPLYEIDIRGTAVTDSTLLKFQKIKTLRNLKLNNCQKITDTAITSFQKARPDVEVER